MLKLDYKGAIINMIQKLNIFETNEKIKGLRKQKIYFLKK